MIEDINLTKRVAAIAAEACQDLFQAYGISLEPTPEDRNDQQERMLCGVIGFVGRGIRGSCVLTGNDTPVLRSCPEGGTVRDWIGELTNQLAGRMKAKFLKHGVEIALSTPVGLSGVALEPLPRNDLKPHRFAAKGGWVLVWVEVDADPAFRFGGTNTPEPKCTEGEILLF